MNQITQERKKYAAGRLPRQQKLSQTDNHQTDTPAISLTDLWKQVRALDVQVQSVMLPRTPKRMPRRPRLRSASAASKAIPGEAAADALSDRQAVLADLLAQARALVPDPPDSPTRRAARESPLDEGIAEKFRQQGFHL